MAIGANGLNLTNILSNFEIWCINIENSCGSASAMGLTIECQVSVTRFGSLPAAILPKDADRWVGNYRWLRNPEDFQMPGAETRISVRKVDGRLWVEYRIEGSSAQQALQPISEKTARMIGPLADTGPIIQIVSREGEPLRVRSSGMTFERMPD